MKALIVILSGIGNAITTLPIIEILNKNNIDVDILVSSKANTDLLSKDFRVRNTYLFNPKNNFIKGLKLIKQLRHEEYDFAITIYPPQGIVSSAILYLINAKIRTQYICNYLFKFVSMKFKIPVVYNPDLKLFEKLLLTHPKKINEEKHAV